MTTATAPVEPIAEWEDDPFAGHGTRASAAGAVAWNVLTHSQSDGADIARIIGPTHERTPLPVAMDAEDMWQFVFDLIQEAAWVGYTVAQIDTSGLDRPWAGAELRTSDVARAVAALLRKDVIETNDTFDPEWLTKANAVYQARKVVAA